MAIKKGHQEFFEIYRQSSDEKKPTEEKLTAQEKDDVRKSAEDIEIPVKKNQAISHKIIKTTDKSQVRKYEPGQWIRKEKKIPDKTDNTIEEKISTVTPNVSPMVAPDIGVSDNKIKSFLKEKVKLSQETIIVGVIATTLLSIACFFIGYKVGYNKGTQLDVINTISIKKEKNVVLDTVKDDGALNILSKSKKDKPIVSGVKQSSDDLWTLRIISYKNKRANILKATDLAKSVKKMTGTNAFVAKKGDELIVCVGKFQNSDEQELIDLQLKMASLVYENKRQFKSCYPVKLK